MIVEHQTEFMKPMGIESIVANSILDYVIDHPEMSDSLAAYNEWVEIAAIPRHFPISEQPLAMFAFQQMDCYIHKCTRASLLMCQKIEADAAKRYERELAKQLATQSMRGQKA